MRLWLRAYVSHPGYRTGGVFCCLRQTDGLTPIRRLKAREKLAFSEKPEASAISAMDRSLPIIKCWANLSFRSSTSIPKRMPSRLSRRMSVVRDQPSRLAVSFSPGRDSGGSAISISRTRSAVVTDGSCPCIRSRRWLAIIGNSSGLRVLGRSSRNSLERYSRLCGCSKKTWHPK
jgi:hypothetical protein